MQSHEPTQFTFGLSLVGASRQPEETNTSRLREAEGGRGSPRQEPARGLPQAQAGLRIQQELGWRCPSQHDTPGRCTQWRSRTCAGRGAWGGEEQGQRPGTPRLGSWWLRSHPRDAGAQHKVGPRGS